MSPEASTFVSATPRDSRQWKVFHAADDFVIEVYAETPSFPKDETYGLTSQMRRAVVSVPANIVEGSARDSEREFLQFLNIAYGSLAEVGYYIHLAKRLGYTTEDQATPLAAHHNELSRMLNGLMRSFQRHGPQLKTQDSETARSVRRNILVATCFTPKDEADKGISFLEELALYAQRRAGASKPPAAIDIDRMFVVIPSGKLGVVRGCIAPVRVPALALSPSLSRRNGKGAAGRAGCVVSYGARGS